MRPNVLKSFSVFEVYNMKQAIAMQKDSYFARQYIEWIAQLIEIGLVSKYSRIYENFYAIENFVEEDRRDFVFTFTQFFPVIVVVVVMYFLAFVLFVLEVTHSSFQRYVQIFVFQTIAMFF